MKKITKLLTVILIMLFAIPVFADAKDISIDSVKVIEHSETADVKSNKAINVVFNDLEQFVKYEIVLKNETDQEYILNDYVINNVSEEFLNFKLDDEYIGKIIEANSSEKVTMTVKTLSIDGAGKNFNDRVELKFIFDEAFENPKTFTNFFEFVLSFVLLSVLIIIFSKINKKSKLFTLVIFVGLFSSIVVCADDSISASVTGKIEFVSQNYLETSGSVVNDRSINYDGAKDIWKYYNDVKNIYISADDIVLEDVYKEFDLSVNESNRVVGYLVGTEDLDVPYDLYIVSKGVIYAPEDSTGLFSFPNVEKIVGIENIVFSDTKIFKGMFINNQLLSSVNFKSLDMSKATDTSYMFYKNYKLDVSAEDFKLSSSVKKANMFVQYLYDVIEKNTINDEGLEFNITQNPAVAVYLHNPSKNDKYPIYYYRGSVYNNYVKFAGYCWRMVRTTDTGGIKLIYSGVPSTNGYCNSTGTATEITRSAFNQSNDSLAYSGYMYGDVFNNQFISSDLITKGTVFASGVEYSDGKYKLADTYTLNNSWSSERNTIGQNYHYTCFNNSDECDMVNYIYYSGDATGANYITLNGEKNIDEAVNKMLSNTTSSTIKNILDNWYRNRLNSYSDKIEDTVWCSDRSVSNYGGWTETSNAANTLIFTGGNRNIYTAKPSFKCANNNDKFTVSDKIGNGKLTYPIGLLTADEVVFAGARAGVNVSYYLSTGSTWWTMTPSSHGSYNPAGFNVKDTSALSANSVAGNYGVRPVISLKHDVEYYSGSGSSYYPYVIE